MRADTKTFQVDGAQDMIDIEDLGRPQWVGVFSSGAVAFHLLRHDGLRDMLGLSFQSQTQARAFAAALVQAIDTAEPDQLSAVSIPDPHKDPV